MFSLNKEYIEFRKSGTFLGQKMISKFKKILVLKSVQMYEMQSAEGGNLSGF